MRPLHPLTLWLVALSMFAFGFVMGASYDTLAGVRWCQDLVNKLVNFK